MPSHTFDTTSFVEIKGDGRLFVMMKENMQVEAEHAKRMSVVAHWQVCAVGCMHGGGWWIGTLCSCVHDQGCGAYYSTLTL
jgi:hypothetical protein